MRNSKMLEIVVVALGLVVWMAGAGEAALVGTAFTYQGSLNDTGAPADGLYDFQFKLFDDANTVTGNQVGSTIDINDLDVIEGSFTVILDFGQSIFTGSARWLEITVAHSDGSDPCTLTPRVELTPAPYALALPGLWTRQFADSTNLIGGHSGNSLSAGVSAATIGGGGHSTAPNKVTDYAGTVSGGVDNQAGDNDGTAHDAAYATVGGGLENKATAEYATVGGGADNTAGLRDTDTPPDGFTGRPVPSHTTVGGGQGNSAKGPYATVGGGINNTASARVVCTEAGCDYSWSTTVAGGENNTARDSFSTVGGGASNKAGGAFSTVSGGGGNEAWGVYSTVPGGYENEAKSDVSFAAGLRAKANHDGTFVWADKTFEDFASTGTNQFLIRASGGVGIGTNYPNEKLTVEGALSLDMMSAPSASAGYGKVYVKSDGELYFKNNAGTEYKLSAGGEDFIAGDYLLNANDTVRLTSNTSPFPLKVTKIGRGGSLTIKFYLWATHPSYPVFAQIWRNDIPVGILRSTNSLSYVTFSEVISGWSKGDVVLIRGYTSNPSYPVYVSNLRLYVDNPPVAGAGL